MRMWNLSSFEDVAPPVLATIERESTVRVAAIRRRGRMRPVTLAGLGTMIIFAAMSAAPIRMTVCGSDTDLRVASADGMTNATVDRPPLELLFGARHPLKWDSAKEQSMLSKAATALSGGSDGQNEVNLIHAVLREQLPDDRRHADDLDSLGIKLG